MPQNGLADTAVGPELEPNVTRDLNKGLNDFHDQSETT
jgi:hypothetical protein